MYVFKMYGFIRYANNFFYFLLYYRENHEKQNHKPMTELYVKQNVLVFIRLICCKSNTVSYFIKKSFEFRFLRRKYDTTYDGLIDIY